MRELFAALNPQEFIVVMSHRLCTNDPLSTAKVVNVGEDLCALSESLYPSAISAEGWSVYGA